jgi:hypothetical protein
MERVENYCQHSYKGTTNPESLNFGQLGLEKYGIKIVPFIFKKEERKTFEEGNFKRWLEDLEERGTCITLWKGKFKVTICQTDYANMKVVGALFIPNKSMFELYPDLLNKREKKLLSDDVLSYANRAVRLKGQSMLMEILTAKSNSKANLLMLLNNVRYNVEIHDVYGRRVFPKKGAPSIKLSEHSANLLLDKELFKIKLRWEALREKAKP